MFLFRCMATSCVISVHGCGKTPKRNDKCCMCNFLFYCYINMLVKQDLKKKKNPPEDCALWHLAPSPELFSWRLCLSVDLWLWVFQKENRIIYQENLYSIVTNLRQTNPKQTNPKTYANPMYLEEYMCSGYQIMNWWPDIIPSSP